MERAFSLSLPFLPFPSVLVSIHPSIHPSIQKVFTVRMNGCLLFFKSLKSSSFKFQVSSSSQAFIHSFMKGGREEGKEERRKGGKEERRKGGKGGKEERDQLK